MIIHDPITLVALSTEHPNWASFCQQGAYHTIFYPWTHLACEAQTNAIYRWRAEDYEKGIVVCDVMDMPVAGYEKHCYFCHGIAETKAFLHEFHKETP